jgi:hypothetical protein
MTMGRIIGAVLVGLAVPAAAQVSDEQMLQRMLSGGPLMDEADLAKAVQKAAAQPLGSRANPVRTHGPRGQHAYLNRLRCSDGAPPRWSRSGNLGPGPYTSIIDNYVVDCGAAAPGKVQVAMDMYHPDHVEQQAVPGFTMQTDAI